MEPKLSSNLEDNIGHPFAPLLYATSTLHCLTVSLDGDAADAIICDAAVAPS
jgi:hypothetical protein